MTKLEKLNVILEIQKLIDERIKFLIDFSYTDKSKLDNLKEINVLYQVKNDIYDKYYQEFNY